MPVIRCEGDLQGGWVHCGGLFGFLVGLGFDAGVWIWDGAFWRVGMVDAGVAVALAVAVSVAVAVAVETEEEQVMGAALDVGREGVDSDAVPPPRIGRVRWRWAVWGRWMVCRV